MNEYRFYAIGVGEYYTAQALTADEAKSIIIDTLGDRSKECLVDLKLVDSIPVPCGATHRE